MLALVAVITLGALTAIVDPVARAPRLEMDSSIDSMLPVDDEARKFYNRARLLFGSDETILVTLVADDVFSEPRLAQIDRMTRRLRRTPGVHHVLSLANALDLRATEDDDLEIAPFMEELPSDDDARERLRRAVHANPLYSGTLVSSDDRATLLFVYLKDLPERDLVAAGSVDAIVRIAREERGDASVSLMGGLYNKAETGRLMLEDIGRTVPLAFLVAMGVAGFSFRSLRGVLIPASTVAISVIWTLGFIAATGFSLNLMTMIIPTLLLVVGFAYAVHVVSDYYDVLSREPASQTENCRREAVATISLREVAIPVILTGVTTAAGFLSLATSPIPAIVQFGSFSTIGIAFTVLVSLTFAPALLSLLPERKPSRGGGRFERLADRLARFDVRRRVPILVSGAVLGVIAAVGAAQIDVSTPFIDPGTLLHRNARILDERFQGANSFMVVLEADSDGAFREPVNLAAVRALQDWLQEQPEIGGTTSLVDYLMLINRAFQGGDPAAFAIPESRSLVSQLLFFGADDELERFVDSRYRTAGVHVRSSVNDSASMADLIARIDSHSLELPRQIRATVTGSAVLVTRALDDTVRGQFASLFFAFAMILAVLALLFTSLRIGLLALLPNALPVLFYFGVVGFTGTTLNSTTGLVACLVLGIAVDDTIHFLARFNSAAKRFADEARGVGEALRSVGRPVTYTSVALCLGFLVMTRSQFQNQVEFGALAALTLAFAWLVDITFTPAMASRMHIVSLWDALTLDLGDDPHLSIPFFGGLRKTQARITALMTSVARFPAGFRLFSFGEAGGHMYVIIDGELSVTLTTNSGTVDFATLRRGDVVGEVAFARGTRTADVTAKTDVRLLLLTRESLERIRRRYPRTGAQLYANLSETLADRVASTTDHLR